MQKLYPNWLQQLNTMLGRELDFSIYEKDFLGAFPICLLGTSKVYLNGKIQDDLTSSINDRCSFQFADSPLVVSISGNSQYAPYHPLVDRASWSFINERKIYHAFLAPIASQIANYSDEKWQALLHLVHNFNQKMMHSIEGNHFLLVGQKRTQQILQIIEEAEKTIADFLKRLGKI